MMIPLPAEWPDGLFCIYLVFQVSAVRRSGQLGSVSRVYSYGVGNVMPRLLRVFRATVAGLISRVEPVENGRSGILSPSQYA
jgi:hypothetical protein